MKGLLVLGKGKNDSAEPGYSDEETDSEAPYQDTASEAMAALQSDDTAGFARAMKSFIKQCMMEEDV